MNIKHTTASVVAMAASAEGEPIERFTAQIKDACRMSGIGRTVLYDLMTRGDVKSVKIGRRRLVLVDSLKQYVKGSSSGGLKGKTIG